MAVLKVSWRQQQFTFLIRQKCSTSIYYICSVNIAANHQVVMVLTYKFIQFTEELRWWHLYWIVHTTWCWNIKKEISLPHLYNTCITFYIKIVSVIFWFAMKVRVSLGRDCGPV
jgi:hypothetical protein